MHHRNFKHSCNVRGLAKGGMGRVAEGKGTKAVVTWASLDLLTGSEKGIRHKTTY